MNMLLRLFFTSVIFSYGYSQDSCINSVTEASIGRTCSRQVIFEDQFDNLDNRKWRNTVRISSVEDEEFVVYNNKQKNIYVQDGKLFIQPTLMPEETVNSGVIDLKTCTGRYLTTDCYMTSSSYNIPPPIESAQITLKDFYFKYGIVEIRAKLPSGDWIYPQLWLEPKFTEYGQLFNSGRIILALTHGNQELLTNDGKDISSKVLKAGFLLGAKEKVFGKSALFEKKTGRWNDEFHNFTFVWKPNSLEAIIDGNSQELMTQNSQSIINEFSFTKEEKELVWPSSSSNAPFDKSFTITLGVAVGGKREFPDESTTKNFHKKPWKNVGSVKRLLNFWRDQSNWFSTWADKVSALQVDYVKVIAL